MVPPSGLIDGNRGRSTLLVRLPVADVSPLTASPGERGVGATVGSPLPPGWAQPGVARDNTRIEKAVRCMTVPLCSDSVRPNTIRQRPTSLTSTLGTSRVCSIWYPTPTVTATNLAGGASQLSIVGQMTGCSQVRRMGPWESACQRNAWVLIDHSATNCSNLSAPGFGRTIGRRGNSRSNSPASWMEGGGRVGPRIDAVAE